MIVQLIIVLNRTVVELLTLIDLSTNCVAVIFRVKVGCIASVGNIKIWL